MARVRPGLCVEIAENCNITNCGVEVTIFTQSSTDLHQSCRLERPLTARLYISVSFESKYVSFPRIIFLLRHIVILLHTFLHFTTERDLSAQYQCHPAGGHSLGETKEGHRNRNKFV